MEVEDIGSGRGARGSGPGISGRRGGCRACRCFRTGAGAELNGGGERRGVLPHEQGFARGASPSGQPPRTRTTGIRTMVGQGAVDQRRVGRGWAMVLGEVLRGRKLERCSQGDVQRGVRVVERGVPVLERGLGVGRGMGVLANFFRGFSQGIADFGLVWFAVFFDIFRAGENFRLVQREPDGIASNRSWSWADCGMGAFDFRALFVA